MSGRGTITSRATVSPNSMMLSISSRSSCSITSSSAAASTMPSSSCSLTNGPSLRPLPGSSTLVSPIRPRLMMRSGQNRTSTSVKRAVASPARSACRTAHVLGIASANTKNTTMLTTEPTPRPRRRRAARRTAGRQRDLHRLQRGDRDEQRVDEPLRVLDQPEQRPADFDSGLVDGVGLDARDAVEPGLGDGQHDQQQDEDDDRDEDQDVRCRSRRVLLTEPGRCRRRASGAAQQVQLARRASPPSRSGSAWSWPSTWSTPWTTSSASSSSTRAGVRRRLVGGDGRAHDDVAEQHRHAGLRGPSSASSGNDSTSVGPSWPRCSALRAAISSRSTNVSVSSPPTPSSPARRGQRSPAVEVDGDVGLLLVGGDHDGDSA